MYRPQPASEAMSELADAVDRLHGQGQLVWLDELSRQLIDDGTLEVLVQAGVGGVTANPTTFDKAISGSRLYDAEIARLAGLGWDEGRILWELLVQDVRVAADILRHRYIESAGLDGYVSIEVSPDLACDTSATLGMARELWNRCDRRNVLIKIPATDAGLPAIERALAEGINVNVTLTFSVRRYEQVVEAFLRGLEARAAAGLPLGNLTSVASFFVSRVDARVDKALGGQSDGEGGGLLGRAAVANGWLAYQAWCRMVRSDRWEPLQRLGATPQRCLWASTGVKDPASAATKYVDELPRTDTILTAPLDTMHVLPAANRSRPAADHPQHVLDQLRERGIDLDDVGAELEVDGVKRFAESFHHLLRTLGERTASARGRSTSVG